MSNEMKTQKQKGLEELGRRQNKTEQRLEVMDQDTRALIKEADNLRLDAKSTLYDRIAVLSAGSIAAIVSIAGLWANQRPPSRDISHIKAELIPALVAAWFALLSALSHNLFLNQCHDSRARSFRSAFLATSSFRDQLDLNDGEELEKAKSYSEAAHEDMLGHQHRANKLEARAKIFGYVSLGMFAMTYLLVIVALIRL